MTGPRGARLNFGGSPWARQALLREPQAVALAERAGELRVHVSITGRSEAGPWVVAIYNRTRTLRFAGHDLSAVIGFGLDRWAAGADDSGIRWSAGPDKLAHGHRGPRHETLCGLPWTDSKYAHPERSRCNECWRALDRRVVAA